MSIHLTKCYRHNAALSPTIVSMRLKFWDNRTKIRKCPSCKGPGIKSHLEGSVNEKNSTLEVKEYATLCEKCQGTGISGIKGLGTLPPEKVYNLAHGKSFDDLKAELDGRTPDEIRTILDGL